MKLIIVSGNTHEIVINAINKKIDIINKNQKLFLNNGIDYLLKVNPTYDGILIIDTLFDPWGEQEINIIQAYKTQLSQKQKLLVLTNDFSKKNLIENVCNSENVLVYLFDYIRFTERTLLKALEAMQAYKPSFFQEAPPRNVEVVEPGIDTSKKKSFFDRFKSAPKTAENVMPTDRITRDFDNLSKGISRVICVTGHRGSGLTSTSVNIANEASKRGLSAILIDMDIQYRGCNAYFDSFHSSTKRDEDMNASLIRTLARPQDYKTTCFNVGNNLWLTSLGYSFSDKKLIDQFYNPIKLIGMLSVFRNKFNTIILDMPMDSFSGFSEALVHIDLFGLCVPNNLYSVLSTLRNIEVIFDSEKAAYINSKSKVIVTKYNDRAQFQGDAFTAETVCKILTSGISESFYREIDSAGIVPYTADFDQQIELDIPIINSSSEYERKFGEILLRLMEGLK